MIRNLATETVDIMTVVGKTAFDVAFVSDGEHWCSFDNFIKEAEHFYYDSGYGMPEVNTSLRINFDDGSWLERAEYDGSEWWGYRAPVTKDLFIENTKVYLEN